MLPTDYQSLIHKLHYARWNDEKKRRETWKETVGRYVEFLKFHTDKNIGIQLGEELWKELYDSTYSLSVMPSMRLLWTAGEAAERDNAATYNCTTLAINSPRAFDETMYLLSCGCGVGFTVERQFISQLPEVPEVLYPTETVVIVRDSRIGWASALKELISLLYGGQIPIWDTSKVRPAGARLKTFGGRASGPLPLERCFHNVVRIFKNAKGRKLNSLECHDIQCFIADAIIAGGTRRSAMLSLSNLSDLRMRGAKSGEWYGENGQRALSNNSVAYTEKPDMGVFLNEWKSLYDSKSGERGIFNRAGAKKRLKEGGIREWDHDFLINPCGEIVLRHDQMCNLTQVTIIPQDDKESILNKLKIATILGTLQSTLTDFRYLNSKWKKNCEEERLLGVGLTGICDNSLTACPSPVFLQDMKKYCREVNKEWANKLGINASTAITTIKPSGNSSQLLNSASGIHPRYASYYLRGIQIGKTDPIGQFLKDSGIPWEVYELQKDSTDIFYFPQKSPKLSLCRGSMRALDQLNLSQIYQRYFTEHQVSATIYLREEEWMEGGAWIYKEWDDISGLSFLPYSEEDHGYSQLPYRELDQNKYKELMEKMPSNLNWEKLHDYEKEDETTGARELSCTGEKCEI